jgi:thiol-disulfide isomerase/thioredoxin
MPPLPPDIPPPVLEVFYSPTCAPCRLELPALAQFAATGEARVRVVIVDEPERGRAELRAVSPGLEAAATTDPSASPRDILRAAGDERELLPYARSLTAEGQVCATWSGGLTMGRARSLMSACARLLTSPRRSRS